MGERDFDEREKERRISLSSHVSRPSFCLSVSRLRGRRRPAALQRSLFVQLTELLPSAAAEEDAVYDMLFALLFDPLEAVSAAAGELSTKSGSLTAEEIDFAKRHLRYVVSDRTLRERVIVMADPQKASREGKRERESSGTAETEREGG
jgi:hypothetical protein